jgi:hypothetical protein
MRSLPLTCAFVWCVVPFWSCGPGPSPTPVACPAPVDETCVTVNSLTLPPVTPDDVATVSLVCRRRCARVLNDTRIGAGVTSLKDLEPLSRLRETTFLTFDAPNRVENLEGFPALEKPTVVTLEADYPRSFVGVGPNSILILRMMRNSTLADFRGLEAQDRLVTLEAQNSRLTSLAGLPKNAEELRLELYFGAMFSSTAELHDVRLKQLIFVGLPEISDLAGLGPQNGLKLASLRSNPKLNQCAAERWADSLGLKKNDIQGNAPGPCP